MQTLFIITLVGLIVAPWWIATVQKKVMSFWAWMFSVIAACVVVTEVVSKVMSGKTISQNFWAYGADNLAMAWALIACMSGAIAILSWHLMAGVYKRRKKNHE